MRTPDKNPCVSLNPSPGIQIPNTNASHCAPHPATCNQIIRESLVHNPGNQRATLYNEAREFSIRLSMKENFQLGCLNR